MNPMFCDLNYFYFQSIFLINVSYNLYISSLREAFSRNQIEKQNEKQKMEILKMMMQMVVKKLISISNLHLLAVVLLIIYILAARVLNK